MQEPARYIHIIKPPQVEEKVMYEWCTYPHFSQRGLAKQENTQAPPKKNMSTTESSKASAQFTERSCTDPDL